jgi:hypothetical protein
MKRAVWPVRARIVLDRVLSISNLCSGERGPHQIIRTNIPTHTLLLRSLTFLTMLVCLAISSVAICGLSARLVGNLTRVGVIESAISVIIELGNLKDEIHLFLCQQSDRFIMNIHNKDLLVDDLFRKFLTQGGADFWSQLGDFLTDSQLLHTRLTEVRSLNQGSVLFF